MSSEPNSTILTDAHSNKIFFKQLYAFTPTHTKCRKKMHFNILEAYNFLLKNWVEFKSFSDILNPHSENA